MLLDNLRHFQALAGRPALMRAPVAVGVVLALAEDDADLDAPGLH
jgi:hypothetical protein